MIQRRLAVDEQLAEDRQQAAVEALFTAKRRRCRGSAGQTVGRQRAQQPAAVGNAQRALGGGSAPLPAEPRAELEDVAVETSPCRHFRRWNALHSSRVCSGHRGVNFYAQVGPRGVRKNSEICHSSRPAPSGAHSSHGWLRGHVEFGLHPLPPALHTTCCTPTTHHRRAKPTRTSLCAVSTLRRARAVVEGAGGAW